MIARFEVRLQKNPFPYPKKYPPPKKKKEYCKGFFWRAYRRGDEAEGREAMGLLCAVVGTTANANAYAEVSRHHALRAASVSRFATESKFGFHHIDGANTAYCYLYDVTRMIQ